MKDFKKYFTQFIRTHYPSFADRMMDNIDKEFEIMLPDVKFAATSSNPIDRRLLFSAYFLALIKVLDQHGESYDRIREVSLEIVKEYVRPKSRFQQFMKKLPVKLIDFKLTQVALRIFAKKVRTQGHPDGFVAAITFDKKDTYGLGYGVDILECGICKLFKKQGYEKFARILCEVDEVTSNLAGLKLIRNGTIANGAKTCDFRYQRIT